MVTTLVAMTTGGSKNAGDAAAWSRRHVRRSAWLLRNRLEATASAPVIWAPLGLLRHQIHISDRSILSRSQRKQVMTLRTINGRLIACGTAETNQRGATLYSYLRFDTGDGSNGYCEAVFAVPELDSVLRSRENQTFYLAEVRLPRAFGSKKHLVLYATRRQGRAIEAIQSTQRLISQQKVAALQLFFYGTFALVLGGLGILLWIWGLRLLAVSLPIGEMRQALQCPAQPPTPS